MLTPEQVADFTERMRATDSVFERVEIVRAIEQAAAGAAMDLALSAVYGSMTRDEAIERLSALRRTDTGGEE